MGDTHTLHIDIDQEIKFPVHTKYLQEDQDRKLDDENLYFLNSVRTRLYFVTKNQKPMIQREFPSAHECLVMLIPAFPL